MNKDEAVKLALDALEGNTTNPVIDPEQAAIEDQAITAIKQALAAPVQEPVLKDNSNYRLDPPEAEPAQKPWVGLTDEEKASLANSVDYEEYYLLVENVEAKLMEKNK